MNNTRSSKLSSYNIPLNYLNNLVHYRCGADAGTHALSPDNGFSAQAKIHTERTLYQDSTARKHCACAVGGLRELQLPIKNGKVVGESYRCWRQLITFGLFFMKVGRKFILLDRNQYFVQDL